MVNVLGTHIGIGTGWALLNYPAVVQGSRRSLSHGGISPGLNSGAIGGSISGATLSYTTAINYVIGSSGGPGSIAYVSGITVFNIVDYHCVVVDAVI